MSPRSHHHTLTSRGIIETNGLPVVTRFFVIAWLLFKPDNGGAYQPISRDVNTRMAAGPATGHFFSHVHSRYSAEPPRGAVSRAAL